MSKRTFAFNVDADDFNYIGEQLKKHGVWKHIQLQLATSCYNSRLWCSADPHVLQVELLTKLERYYQQLPAFSNPPPNKRLRFKPRAPMTNPSVEQNARRDFFQIEIECDDDGFVSFTLIESSPQCRYCVSTQVVRNTNWDKFLN
jgi:hypothetical protein